MRDVVIDLERERPRYRLRRMVHDFDIIARARPGHPLPLTSAPWREGPTRHAVHYPHQHPITAHLWSHFETFISVEAMLYRWVVDEDFWEDWR